MSEQPEGRRRMGLKQDVNSVLRRVAGYEIRRAGLPAPPPSLGADPFADMRKLTQAGERPLVFDVGANVGQTIGRLRETFREPCIHAFEPTDDTFAELQRRTVGMPDLIHNNLALGAHAGTGELFENTSGSQLNSLLEKGTECWGEIKTSRTVSVGTVDDYCAANHVERIDVLKTDTQGYDLEVMRGACRMMSERRVHMLYMEIIFNDMYKGLPGLDDIWGYVTGHGFELVSFYRFYYWADKASWTEALFVHPEYRREA